MELQAKPEAMRWIPHPLLPPARSTIYNTFCRVSLFFVLDSLSYGRLLIFECNSRHAGETLFHDHGETEPANAVTPPLRETSRFSAVELRRPSADLHLGNQGALSEPGVDRRDERPFVVLDEESQASDSIEALMDSVGGITARKQLAMDCRAACERAYSWVLTAEDSTPQAIAMAKIFDALGLDPESDEADLLDGTQASTARGIRPRPAGSILCPVHRTKPILPMLVGDDARWAALLAVLAALSANGVFDARDRALLRHLSLANTLAKFCFLNAVMRHGGG